MLWKHEKVVKDISGKDITMDYNNDGNTIHIHAGKWTVENGIAVKAPDFWKIVEKIRKWDRERLKMEMRNEDIKRDAENMVCSMLQFMDEYKREICGDIEDEIDKDDGSSVALAILEQLCEFHALRYPREVGNLIMMVDDNRMMCENLHCEVEHLEHRITQAVEIAKNSDCDECTKILAVLKGKKKWYQEKEEREKRLMEEAEEEEEREQECKQCKRVTIGRCYECEKPLCDHCEQVDDKLDAYCLSCAKKKGMVDDYPYCPKCGSDTAIWHHTPCSDHPNLTIYFFECNDGDYCKWQSDEEATVQDLILKWKGCKGCVSCLQPTQRSCFVCEEPICKNCEHIVNKESYCDSCWQTLTAGEKE